MKRRSLVPNGRFALLPARCLLAGGLLAGQPPGGQPPGRLRGRAVARGPLSDRDADRPLDRRAGRRGVVSGRGRLDLADAPRAATDITIARDLLAGWPGPPIPNGRIVRGSPHANVGWSWHLDPTDFASAEVATEVCDGNPGGVEDGTLTSDRYCPWSATVVAVDPAP